MNDIHCRIDEIKDKNKFSKACRYINEYELVPQVCKLEPTTRAFYKLYEILNEISTRFHRVIFLAEGPGGFIDAVLMKFPSIKWDAITLASNDEHLLFKNKCKNLHYGDLTCDYDVDKFCKKMSKADLITADGGIDVSKDAREQEMHNLNLFFHEIKTALRLQKKGGTFILKIYDIYLESTLTLLYNLSLYYEQINIVKPLMSRPCNSEKYVVCQGFNGNFVETNNFWNQVVSDEFRQRVHGLIQPMIQKQFDCLDRVLKLFPKTYKLNQKQKAIEYCKKFNLPIK